MALPNPTQRFLQIYGRYRNSVSGVLVSGPNRAVVGELVNTVEVAVVGGNQQLTVGYQNEDSNYLTRVITVPQVGTGRQIAATYPDIIRSLWKAASSLPPTSELTGANAPSLDSEGVWTASTVPTGWEINPATPTVGAGQELYEAIFLSSWNGSAYSQPTPEILVASPVNVRYSDSLLGTNPYYAPTANAVARSRRNPTTRQWGAWLPIATTTAQAPSWNQLISHDMRTTNASQVWAVAAAVKPRWADILELYVEVENFSATPWKIGRLIRPNWPLASHTATDVVAGQTCRMQAGNDGSFNFGQSSYTAGLVQQNNDGYFACNLLFREDVLDRTRLGSVFLDRQKVLRSSYRVNIWYR